MDIVFANGFNHAKIMDDVVREAAHSIVVGHEIRIICNWEKRDSIFRKSLDKIIIDFVESKATGNAKKYNSGTYHFLQWLLSIPQ